MIEPVVDEHGCELVDVEVARNRGQGLLRITVDSPDADGRVPIERCVAISREVETLLDAGEAMSGAYQLEVSSPGLDRLLGREKDFIAAVGQEVKLRTRRPIEGRKRFRGRLLAVDSEPETALRMQVDGETFAIPFVEVEKANTIYEFTSDDFRKRVSDPPERKRVSDPPKRKRVSDPPDSKRVSDSPESKRVSDPSKRKQGRKRGSGSARGRVEKS